MAFSTEHSRPLCHPLPSGKVAAGDGTMFENEAYTRVVPPGRYKVQLVVANFGDALKPNKRNAFAILRISNEPIVSWEMAVKPGQDLSKLSPGDVYGYPVGTGTGCFADPNAGRAINAAMFTELYGPPSPAFKAMDNNGETTCYAVKVDTEQGSAVLFGTGWGDGSYASYFGLDASGTPVVLVSDFQLLDWANGFTEEE